MSLFAWSDSYSVGSNEIDEQHKKLFQMADELHRAMSEGRGKEALVGLLQRLVAYTRHHFASEERAMREHAYPNYLQHHMEHEKLTAQVLEFQNKVVRGQTTVTIDIMTFLSDWLRNHIQASDQKLAKHIRSQAGAPTAARR